MKNRSLMVHRIRTIFREYEHAIPGPNIALAHHSDTCKLCLRYTSAIIAFRQAYEPRTYYLREFARYNRGYILDVYTASLRFAAESCYEDLNKRNKGQSFLLPFFSVRRKLCGIVFARLPLARDGYARRGCVSFSRETNKRLGLTNAFHSRREQKTGKTLLDCTYNRGTKSKPSVSCCTK